MCSRSANNLFWLICSLSLPICASGITIQVDYRYDSNGFFDASGNPRGADGAAKARAAIAAAAARWSAIIDQSLLKVETTDDELDVRIGFTHPGTGNYHEVSSAASNDTDALVAAGVRIAEEYRDGMHIPKDVWVLYVGARPLNARGVGGTGSGTNFTQVFDNVESHLNRGLNSGQESLPTWGGYVSFDNDGSTMWHFNHLTALDDASATDLYSLALHEIGHALGLNAVSAEWSRHLMDNSFAGNFAVQAYNALHGTSIESLRLDPSGDLHWEKGTYQSPIFHEEMANYIGTGGRYAFQELLMDPNPPVGKRFEATVVDVAALRDVGWSVIPEHIEDSEISEAIFIEYREKAVVVRWTVPPRATYTLLESTNLKDWRKTDSEISTDDGLIYFAKASSSKDRQFFRLETKEQ